MKIEYAEVIKWVKNNHPEKLHDFLESISPNQIKCKKWLAQELEAFVLEEPWREFSKTFPLHIEQIGGWCGWPMLDFISHLPIQSYRNVDPDPFAIKVFNRYRIAFDPMFKTQGIEDDIRNLNSENSTHGSIRVVINTSCEHMDPLPELIMNRGYMKEKVVFFLQSNNMFDEPTHINCVSSVEEFVEQSGLNQIYFSGEKDMGTYKRFMVVGKF